MNEYRTELGTGNIVLIYEKMVIPGKWDWRVKSKFEYSGLYQLPSKEHWSLIGWSSKVDSLRG